MAWQLPDGEFDPNFQLSSSSVLRIGQVPSMHQPGIADFGLVHTQLPQPSQLLELQ